MKAFIENRPKKKNTCFGDQREFLSDRACNQKIGNSGFRNIRKPTFNGLSQNYDEVTAISMPSNTVYIFHNIPLFLNKPAFRVR